MIPHLGNIGNPSRAIVILSNSFPPIENIRPAIKDSPLFNSLLKLMERPGYFTFSRLEAIRSPCGWKASAGINPPKTVHLITPSLGTGLNRFIQQRFFPVFFQKGLLLFQYKTNWKHRPNRYRLIIADGRFKFPFRNRRQSRFLKTGAGT
jgi:hypothetical protein